MRGHGARVALATGRGRGRRAGGHRLYVADRRGGADDPLLRGGTAGAGGPGAGA